VTEQEWLEQIISVVGDDDELMDAVLVLLRSVAATVSACVRDELGDG
jgi:hypothetical protein